MIKKNVNVNTPSYMEGKESQASDGGICMDLVMNGLNAFFWCDF